LESKIPKAMKKVFIMRDVNVRVRGKVYPLKASDKPFRYQDVELVLGQLKEEKDYYIEDRVLLLTDVNYYQKIDQGDGIFANYPSMIGKGSIINLYDVPATNRRNLKPGVHYTRKFSEEEELEKQRTADVFEAVPEQELRSNFTEEMLKSAAGSRYNPGQEGRIVR
jgi:hypothetical protein